MAKVYEYILKAKDQVTDKLKKIARSSGEADQGIMSYKKNMDKASSSTSGFGSIIKRVAPMLIGFFSIAQMLSFNNALVSTTAEFEKYEAVLTNTFQSAKMGKASMSMIEDFASKTPFQVNQLTGSFVKLANRGLIPTKKQMTSMGDVASSQGKSFDQYTEALLDAQTGEFERLKEFGIKASKAGDKVSFMFKGQASTVANTEKAITDYLISIGQMDGVAGSMDVISKTTGGMISNMQDKATMLRKKWGGDMKLMYQYVITHIGGALDWLTSNVSLKEFATKTVAFFESVKPAVITLGKSFYSIWTAIQPLFGAFKTLANDLFGTTSASQGANSMLSTLSGVITSLALPIEIVATGLSVVLGWITPLIKPIGFLTVGIWALNIAMSANPISLIIIGFVALVGAISYAYNKFEWFRGGILGVWETVKGFGTMIKDYVVTRFWELISTVSNAGKTLMYIMSGQFKKAFESGKEAIKGFAGVESKKQLFNDAKGLGEKFSDGYNQGVAQIKTKDQLAEFKEKSSAFKKSRAGASSDGDSYESMLSQFTGGGAAGADGGSSSGSSSGSKGLSGITGGGSKQTNITINLGKLLENVNINTTNIQEGAQGLESLVQQTLLRVLNSANQMQNG